MKKIFMITIILLISACAPIRQIKRDTKEIENIVIKSVDLDNVKDGVYRGNVEYTLIKVEVEVTVKNNSIISIELIRHNNGKGRRAEKITDRVLQEQSIDVDIIAGATYSSKVILKAIESALKKGLTIS